MPLKKRIIRVHLEIPSTTSGAVSRITLDERLMLRVRIQKAALAIQNMCTIDIGGLSTSLRERLISNFTAWDKRVIDRGGDVRYWVDVRIEAGYSVNGVESVSTIYRGQVVLADLSAPPPSAVVTLQCLTRQQDKTKYVSGIPADGSTFKELVAWAARQMEFGDRYVINTRHENDIIPNAARNIYVVGAILPGLQAYYFQDIVAFVDDDILYVVDSDRAINPSDVAQIHTFVGMPAAQEWGINFKTLFDPNVRLVHAVRLHSLMNPTLNNRDYTIYTVSYDLATRDGPFYVSATGVAPSGQSDQST